MDSHYNRYYFTPGLSTTYTLKTPSIEGLLRVLSQRIYMSIFAVLRKWTYTSEPAREPKVRLTLRVGYLAGENEQIDSPKQKPLGAVRS
jgi:hypothetical protein